MCVRSFLFIILFAAIALPRKGKCQETVFALLKKDLKMADGYFEERNFQTALNLYMNVARKNHSSRDIHLKIARCHYFLKQYTLALDAFDKHKRMTGPLPLQDIYYYAEARSATSDYGKAIDAYKEYLVSAPDYLLVTQKIWRLNNIRFLYEDSLHYAVRPIRINTSYGELCPVPYRQGLVFMSNRKEVQLVEKVDASLNAPFYRIYYSMTSPDTANSGMLVYAKPFLFKELNSRFHAGPVAFYDDEKKMVFASTGVETGANGGRTLQLYFAEEKEGDWKVTHTFPYNDIHYSISDPTISENGTTLYFSSDMKGGMGGKDLYRSEYINGRWTKPENLGEVINTIHDEVFPYLHQDRTLYFSSNGHPGLGGLDIFRSQINEEGFEETQNAGYPVNTHGDEFGIIIDSINTHGYFSSNREKGGYNDDIYEFDMDLQTYPLEISGLIRYKEHNWSDSSELKPFVHAKLYLMDNIRDMAVHESSSDSTGNFSLVIPYFSKYRIRVIGKDNDEHIVSLEIPKHRQLHSKHEIVIVKDAFRSPENQSIK